MESIFSAVDAAADMPAFWKVMTAFFHSEGITRACFVHFPPAGAPDQDLTRVRADGYPEEWIDRYVAGGLHMDDPIRAQAAVNAAPFRWSEIRKLRALTAEQEAFMEEFADINSGDGMAIPVFGPNGRNGYVGLAVPEGMEEMTPEMLQRSQVVAQYAHQRYCELVTQGLADYPPLSPREVEVLGWVARGKSNSVIADILGLSSNTVDTHLRRIYAKLRVSDRVSAALAGLGHGIISIR